MKHTTLIFTILIAFVLAACNDSDKGKKQTFPPGPNYNGHYLIESFVLDGDCENPYPFELIIWNGNVYENVAHEHINITGTIEGKELTGIVDFIAGEQAVFDAAMVNAKNLSGDWYYTDGTCLGYLTGRRIIE